MTTARLGHQQRQDKNALGHESMGSRQFGHNRGDADLRFFGRQPQNAMTVNQPQFPNFFSYLTSKRLKQGRKDMTVCVAAICEMGNRIVMASDSRIGDEVMSADTPIAKFVSFKNWTAMFAGKLGDCRAIIKAIRRAVENSTTNVDEIAMMRFRTVDARPQNRLRSFAGSHGAALIRRLSSGR